MSEEEKTFLEEAADNFRKSSKVPLLKAWSDEVEELRAENERLQHYLKTIQRAIDKGAVTDVPMVNKTKGEVTTLSGLINLALEGNGNG